MNEKTCWNSTEVGAHLEMIRCAPVVEITIHSTGASLAKQTIRVSLSEARSLVNCVQHVIQTDFVNKFVAEKLGAERERLKHVFDAVCDPKDWRAPIKAYVRDFKREEVAEAIVFFTATEAAFEDAGNGWLKVTAPGYRLGPAGDH